MSGKLRPNLGLDAKFGTGFCLDTACGFIATNYHVAVTARPDKIKREKIVQRYFATGPDDKGATPNDLPNLGVFGYATKRDLAIFQLQRPLRRHHGLSFNLDELQVGQEVTSRVTPKELSILSANSLDFLPNSKGRRLQDFSPLITSYLPINQFPEGGKWWHRR